jgi:hypothetical protein
VVSGPSLLGLAGPSHRAAARWTGQGCGATAPLTKTAVDTAILGVLYSAAFLVCVGASHDLQGHGGGVGEGEKVGDPKLAELAKVVEENGNAEPEDLPTGKQ